GASARPLPPSAIINGVMAASTAPSTARITASGGAALAPKAASATAGPISVTSACAPSSPSTVDSGTLPRLSSAAIEKAMANAQYVANVAVIPQTGTLMP